MADWAGIASPTPRATRASATKLTEFPAARRAQVGYADIPGDVRTPEVQWLRSNPHRLHLGRIGFVLTKEDGSSRRPRRSHRNRANPRPVERILKSHFVLEGVAVDVETAVDLIDRARCASSRLWSVRDGSPSSCASPTERGPHGRRLVEAGGHRTVLGVTTAETAILERRLDQDALPCEDAFPGRSPCARRSPSLRPEPGSVLGHAGAGRDLQSLRAALDRPRRHRSRMGRAGTGIRSGRQGAHDRPHPAAATRGGGSWSAASSSPNTSPPSSVLAGSPPGERPHLQLLGRQVPPRDALVARRALRAVGQADLARKSLSYYVRILPRAKATAQRQGYAGARWPR
jgi:hypothetical protein